MSVFDMTSATYFPSISAAITGSNANDTIQVSAGSYVENFPDITHNLTIESVGGLAALTTPLPEPANSRAILEVPVDANVSLTISGLSLSGAIDSPVQSNGAGLLFEVGNANLTIINSSIFDNQDGILTGGVDAASTGGMTVTIVGSEIDNNGVDPSNPRYGFDHNIYVGAVTQLTVEDSYIHDALGGHEIKSRAYASTIIGNRIEDGATATTSYSIDLPDGGNDIVANNTIEKGASSPNRYVVHYAGDATYPGSSLLLTGNTVINDRAGGATLLYNQTQDPGGSNIPAYITDNTTYNVDYLDQANFAPPPDVVTGNIAAAGPPPPLDTSSPFAVPEPGGASLLPFVLLITAMIRRRGAFG